MIISKPSIKAVVIFASVLFVAGGTLVYASHSWGNYHWARQSSPFTLKLGDNVSSAWDAYLGETSSDWSISTVLDTTIVRGGTNPKNCRATNGRVEVCSSKYGFNGWLGVASIWISGSHITKSTVKVNDSYFNTATYNTPPWRRLVMCQEVGHTFGLDHQDENFSNTNLSTCMDYTSDPDGPPSNEYPNAHDYEQLEAIYAHLDSTTTIGQTVSKHFGNGNKADASDWGKKVRKDSKGRTSMYVRDLENNEKVFTFVLWAD
ncbi:MAG: hypothetical protein A3J46_05620 [Candidatus Yanofskybacteria bacterium RIFCSPHIGHO2_02_FULL_41_11]|uniref:Peptidase M10 metallopeptidase domain-containing protein n=1 Tax=Candidatus Yanofskybacteria bacterium RIFCSPHIGHO2_02_FULL_41_11 TaxID=1802675 RepID=A0A1F8F9J4_9BACT|nr:MAG: hypothetical protein A3J46_05620 [Candidatus Yanofskybacteria bacterium RIFCSPHIGHO2_02_FULL_41_11]